MGLILAGLTNFSGNIVPRGKRYETTRLLAGLLNNLLRSLEIVSGDGKIVTTSNCPR